jgi:bifunctional non-homologous end joining protein LigD
MSLDQYRAKRDFTKTPEPPPRVTKRPAGRRLFFCVQKHLASHLHYDFRLEHSGVLLSWAVPKGPSLDPSVKRLAMHVEDHPLDYGEFEGVIPEGYGAGIVMLWDHGTWEPEVGDVDEALRTGDLKFQLDGYKLKGSWVLVRTRRYGDNRGWLLIKHRDEWAGPVNITEFAPLSVKSNGNFEDILAADNPAIWTSNRPATGGETGAMLQKVVERALALKAERDKGTRGAAHARRASGATRAKRTQGAGGITGARAAGRARAGHRRKRR